MQGLKKMSVINYKIVCFGDVIIYSIEEFWVSETKRHVMGLLLREKEVILINIKQSFTLQKNNKLCWAGVLKNTEVWIKLKKKFTVSVSHLCCKDVQKRKVFLLSSANYFWELIIFLM